MYIQRYGVLSKIVFISGVLLFDGENMKNERCWKGYEPVKGKKPYSSGSCKKSASTKKTQSKPKSKGK